jgi:beta-lactam-binding protein with PASTA domain
MDFSSQPDPPPAASQIAKVDAREQAASTKPVLTVAVDQGGDIEVPDFSGKTMRDVTDIVLRLGLDPVLVGSNLATEQSPAPGAKVRHGARITVQFGTPLEKKSKPHPGIRN